MIEYDPKHLLVSACARLVPSYTKYLEMRGEQSNDPLDDLRKKLALIVKEKFEALGEATFVVGCMHYPKEAEEPFLQTQTLPSDLCPKTLTHHGDHTHSKAVTLDMRCAPDEIMEHTLDSGITLSLPSSLPVLHPHGPDFARREISQVSHIQDFKHVKGIRKIYLERIPNFEKGPMVGNLQSFKEFYNLLDKGGVLAFDYVPFYDLFTSDKHSITYFANRAMPRARRAEPGEFDRIKQSVKVPGINEIAEYYGFTCSHTRECPANPCDELAGALAASILTGRLKEEVLVSIKEEVKADAKVKPKAVLTSQELVIKVDRAIMKLELFLRTDQKDLPLGNFGKNGIGVLCRADRTPEEKESLLYQVECYRTLVANPDLESEIDPTMKGLLDFALNNLVQKVVFPQLKLLGFEAVSFSPNGVNPENNRPFNRVIYVKKQ